MSRKNSFLVTLFFEALGLGLLFYAASRTLNFVTMTMPANKQYMGYLYLLSTGIGALIWMGTYLKKAKGAQQRGIAFGMGILDLIGEFVMVYADTIYVSSQSGKVTMTQGELSFFILASVAIMAINAIAYYAFKLADPDASAEQKAQDLVDDATESAYKNLNSPDKRKAMIDKFSPQIEAAIMAKVTDNIADAVGRNTQTVITPQAALPSPTIAIPGNMNWLEWLGEKLKEQQDEPRKYEKAIPSVSTSTTMHEDSVTFRQGNTPQSIEEHAREEELRKYIPMANRVVHESKTHTGNNAEGQAQAGTEFQEP